MARVAHHRQHTSRTQDSPGRLQRHKGFVFAGDDLVVGTRQVSQIEHHRADSSRDPIRQQRMALLEKLHPSGQARRFDPGAGGFNGDGLEIDRDHPPRCPHQPGQEERIMAISRRGIH